MDIMEISFLLSLIDTTYEGKILFNFWIFVTNVVNF